MTGDRPAGDEPLGAATEFEVTRIGDGGAETIRRSVATEVPCTIVVNGREAVTAMVTPTHLREFAVGHLFGAGIIGAAADVTGFACDEARWRLDVETSRPVDLELLGKRLYTSGCGKGVMYSSVIELAARRPLPAGPALRAAQLVGCMQLLLSGSPLSRATRGLHTAALSIGGDPPALLIDDIGRHNAVDKVIGDGLLRGLDLTRAVLLSTGRTSSEILFKAKRALVPIVVSRGAPTHQTVLLAREMGATVASYRAGEILVYSGRERVVAD